MLATPSNSVTVLSISLSLVGCRAEKISVVARTQIHTVEFEIDELSLRANGQDWYDDWTPLQHPEWVQLDSNWQELGWIDSSEQEYFHLFLDADRVFLYEQEIIDIVEPTALKGPISRGSIQLELEVLEAPSGTGLFLRGAH